LAEKAFDELKAVVCQMEGSRAREYKRRKKETIREDRPKKGSVGGIWGKTRGSRGRWYDLGMGTITVITEFPSVMRGIPKGGQEGPFEKGREKTQIGVGKKSPAYLL